jgi:hypothetical protein
VGESVPKIRYLRMRLSLKSSETNRAGNLLLFQQLAALQPLAADQHE